MSQKRKRYLIDPTVQWAVARRVALHWVGFFAVLLAVNSLVGMLLSVPEKSMSEIAIVAVRSQTPLVFVMLLILPIFLRDTIRLSNKFAGPMYRLRIGLNSLAEGKQQGVMKFRTSDFWQDVAERFNSVRERMESLDARNRELERENRNLREQLEAATDTVTL